MKKKQFIRKANVINEDWLRSFKQLVVNPVVGVGQAITSLGKGDLKGVAKGVWKTLSAPIGVITQLGQPDRKELQDQYNKSKTYDFKTGFGKKGMDQVNAKWKTDDQVRDAFANWSQAAKEFLEDHKDDVKADDIRKILAYRKALAAVKQNEDELKKAAKEAEEETNDGSEQEQADDFKKFKDILLYVCKEQEKQKLDELFDKKLGQGKVLYIHPKKGKLFSWTKDKANDKKLAVLEKTKDEAKAARAKK